MVRVPALLLPFVLFLSGCGRTEPLTDDELVPFQGCSSDVECVLVTNGCLCEVAAIAVERRGEFEAIFSCESLPSCAPHNLIPVCDSGRCAAVLAP